MKKNDFIEISFTGSVDGNVFDTTDEKVAQANGIFDSRHRYGPITICLGRGHVLPGLDTQLLDKDPGTPILVQLRAEQAFGKKRTDLIQLIPTNRFRKEKIMPEPGLRIQVDGMMGTVKTVTGGRTLIDFNHPLAGRDITYEVVIHRQVTDMAERIKAFFAMELGATPEVTLTGFDAQARFPQSLPKEVADKIAENLKNAIPELHNVTFTPP